MKFKITPILISIEPETPAEYAFVSMFQRGSINYNKTFGGLILNMPMELQNSVMSDGHPNNIEEGQ